MRPTEVDGGRLGLSKSRDGVDARLESDPKHFRGGLPLVCRHSGELGEGRRQRQRGAGGRHWGAAESGAAVLFFNTTTQTDQDFLETGFRQSDEAGR